jgi:hypothetical protein
MRDIQPKPSGSIPPTSQDGERMFAVGMEIPYRAQKGPIHSFRVRLSYGKYRWIFFSLSIYPTLPRLSFTVLSGFLSSFKSIFYLFIKSSQKYNGRRSCIPRHGRCQPCRSSHNMEVLHDVRICSFRWNLLRF